MITTIYGDRDEALFEKREGRDENDNEVATWVEYWDNSVQPAVLVHRSAHIQLKRWPEGMSALQGVFQ